MARPDLPEGKAIFAQPCLIICNYLLESSQVMIKITKRTRVRRKRGLIVATQLAQKIASSNSSPFQIANTYTPTPTPTPTPTHPSLRFTQGKLRLRMAG
jgi:hypothetical protein